MKNLRPAVGVGVLIVKETSILLGKRKNAHGAETWSPPGGHMEFGESLIECAAREIAEETGLVVGSLYKGPYTNDIFKDEEKHYISIFMIAQYKSGEPELREPDKCAAWQWFDVQALPENLFLPLKNLIGEFNLASLVARPQASQLYSSAEPVGQASALINQTDRNGTTPDCF